MKKLINYLKNYFLPDYYGMVRSNKYVVMNLAIKATKLLDDYGEMPVSNKMNFELTNLN